MQAGGGNRVIVTVLGEDRIGIIAAITGVLAEARVNILDIHQTIMGGMLVMVLLGDLTHSPADLGELQERLRAGGGQVGVQVTAQHEDVFHFMHRV